MIRQMDMECIHISMEQNTKVFGRMISSMEMASKLGWTEVAIRGHIASAESMDQGHTNGTMAHSIQDNGLKTKYSAQVFIHGQTEGVTRVSGKITTCMESVHIFGTMEDHIKDSIQKTRNMGTVFTGGKTEENMPVTGIKENSMVLEFTEQLLKTE